MAAGRSAGEHGRQLHELLAAQTVEPLVGPAVAWDSSVAGVGEVLRVTPVLGGADLVDLRISTRVHPAELISPLTQLGLNLGSYSQPHHLIKGQLPVSSLAAAAELPGVQRLAPLDRPWSRTGSVTSQGDAILKAVEARAAGYGGTGVTVGVPSDSANRVGGGVAGSIAAGDLPGPGNRAPTCWISLAGRWTGKRMGVKAKPATINTPAASRLRMTTSYCPFQSVSSPSESEKETYGRPVRRGRETRAERRARLLTVGGRLLRG